MALLLHASQHFYLRIASPKKIVFVSFDSLRLVRLIVASISVSLAFVIYLGRMIVVFFRKLSLYD